jgi:hypothetical protein
MYCESVVAWRGKIVEVKVPGRQVGFLPIHRWLSRQIRAKSPQKIRVSPLGLISLGRYTY